VSIAVVIPTLPARSEVCERTVAAFKEQGAEVLLVSGASTCGEGWAAGLRSAEADYILLGCDDAVPHPGAVEAGMRAADDGIYPSPRIVLADGTLESCGTLGGGGCHLPECPDGTLANMSSFPIATAQMWERIGEPPDIHYYVDDYLGYMARCIGLDCQVVRNYAFTHHDEQHGRARVIARAWEDRDRFREAIIANQAVAA
jgi:hypothetical protein